MKAFAVALVALSLPALADDHPVDRLVMECPKAKLTIDHPSRKWMKTKFYCDANGLVKISD